MCTCLTTTDITSVIIRAAFLRLNIIDLYNFYMGFVDLADQLRNVYRPDHFSRKRKWWTAMFWWAHGVCMTNAYIIYIHTCARDELRPHEIHSHRDFLELVAEGYMFEETIGYPSPIPSPCKPQKKKRSAKAPTRQVALAAKKQRGPNTSPTVSSVSGGAFTQRRVRIGIHTLIPNADATIGNNHRCAVCWYDKPIEGAVGHVEQAIRKNSRVRCGHCMVYMCLDCWPRWHS